MGQSDALELVRFVVVGSVDDGKSTLIGRLIWETGSLYTDHYDAIDEYCRRKGMSGIDLSLVCDGLADERQQHITIDVAYRYFSTSQRRFIVADAPGHEQYTRNMLCASSQAEIALLVIDGQNGVLPQTKRHAGIVSLMDIDTLVVVINKMDLVMFQQTVYEKIVDDFSTVAHQLNLDRHRIVYIPVSALAGDCITEPSTRMTWYQGPTLLQILHECHVQTPASETPFRLPVQLVIRPDAAFRGYAGTIAAGSLEIGQRIVALASMRRATVEKIFKAGVECQRALKGQSVVIGLSEKIDISRGDMVVDVTGMPKQSSVIDCMICWMAEESLVLSSQYLMKHTTKIVACNVVTIHSIVDGDAEESCQTTLAINQIGSARITLASPIFFDPYSVNRETGSFILIDQMTDQTVAAGIIITQDNQAADSSSLTSRDELQPQNIHSPDNLHYPNRQAWEAHNGHKASILWITGLPASGKTTIAHRLTAQIFTAGYHCVHLDGDVLRHTLCRDLGFSREDRRENIRRIAQTAALFFESGIIAVCSCISPFSNDRQVARALVPEGRFVEIYVKCSLEQCMKRDPKGLYKKACAGEIADFTGISSPYEVPAKPEIILETDRSSIEECVGIIIDSLKKMELIP
ncbi:MAG: adenylyl-sulfate kinase [Chitinivibrionales bacterium]|nr:adenylyl-sulfate kinase [Chitinivibrionales bacterium]